MKNVFFVLVMMVMLAGCGEEKKVKATQNSSSGKQQSAGQSSAGATPPMISAGMEYLRQGDIRQAITSFDEAIKQNPKDIQGYLILGQTYMHIKEYNRAIDTFIVAAQIDPENGQARYLLATNFGLAGNFDMARLQAQKSAEIFRNNKDEDNFKRSVALLQGLPAGQPPDTQQK